MTTEDKVTYDDNVLKIATEMAEVEYNKNPYSIFSYSRGHTYISFDNYNQREKMIEAKIEDARVALKYIAKEVKVAWIAGRHMVADKEIGVEEYLQSQGFVPVN